MPGAELGRLPALRGRTFYQRLFTPLVCLWYLLFQRLHPDHTLDAALADARSGGAVLDCAMGSIHVSEQVMACRLILGSAGKLLFIGDRNFGVFRVVQTARHAGQEVLLRLTECRARRLLGGALPPGEHAIIWEPTRQDQRQPGCNPKPVPGRLLVLQLRRPGFRSQHLYLFTTLPAQFGLQEAARLYGLRWHVELNLRYLKTQMDLVQLEAKSPDMARKEWLAGLMAYNLIRAAQLCAALAKKVSPLTLSFSSTRRRLEDWLRQWAHHPRQALRLWPQILESIGHCRHPVRRKARPTEPRAQRHLRQPYAPSFGSRAQARRNLKKYASKS